MKVKILSIPIHLISILFFAFFYFIFSNWFGLNDLPAYLVWTFTLSIGLAIFGDAILQIIPFKKGVLRTFLLSILSGCLAFSWVHVVFLFLGPWINTFSVPIFPLWWIGIISQLLFIDYALKPKNLNYQPFISLIGLVAYYMFTISLIYLVFQLL